jgi:hypothetical protein
MKKICVYFWHFVCAFFLCISCILHMLAVTQSVTAKTAWRTPFYVNAGYVHRLAERWRVNVHELSNHLGL